MLARLRGEENDDAPAQGSPLDWSGTDGEGWWLAKSSGIDYEVKHPTPESDKWIVVVIEGDASQVQRLSKKSYDTAAAAMAAAEADFIDRKALL